jgi:hypothetical protein
VFGWYFLVAVAATVVKNCYSLQQISNVAAAAAAACMAAEQSHSR